MSEKEIMKVFSDLGIETKEVPQYYSPEEFGRDLLYESNRATDEVSHSGKAYRDGFEKNATAVYS